MAKYYEVDGHLTEFPDDMSEDDIAKVIMAAPQGAAPSAVEKALIPTGKSTPGGPTQQDTGWTRLPRLAGHAMLDGLSQTAGLPGDLVALAGAGLDRLIGKKQASGGEATTSPGLPEGLIATDFGPMPSRLPTTEEYRGQLNAMGLGRGPELEPGKGPLGLAEKLGYGAIAGGTAGVLGAPLAPGAGLLAGAAGGAGSELAQELAPGSTVAALGGGLAGGLAGGAVAGSLRRAAALGELRDAFKASEGTLQGTQAELAAARAERQALKDSRVGKEAERAAEAQHATLQGEADAAALGVVQAHGGPASLQEAGEGLQGAVRQWRTAGPEVPGSFQASHAQAWAPIDAAVSGELPTPLTQFNETVLRLGAPNGSLQPYSQPLDSRLMGTYRQRLEASMEENARAVAAGEAAPAVLGTEGTWAEARRLRAQLGEAMASPSMAGDQKDIAALYAALSQDQRAALGGRRLTATGQSLADALDEANSTTQQLHQLNQGLMSKIIAAPGAGGDRPGGQVAQSLLGAASKDGADMATLRAMFPAETDRLLAAHLTGPDGGLNLDAWKKLSPEGKRFLASGEAHVGLLDQVSGDKARFSQALKDQLEELRYQAAVAGNENAKRLDVAKALEVRHTQEMQAAKQAWETELKGATAGGAIGVGGVGVGGYLGGNLGHDLFSQIGHGAEQVLQRANLGHSLGMVAGAAAPFVARGAYNTVRNPKRVTNPLIGALGAESAGVE